METNIDEVVFGGYKDTTKPPVDNRSSVTGSSACALAPFLTANELSKRGMYVPVPVNLVLGLVHTFFLVKNLFI